MKENEMFDEFNARLSDIVNSRFSLGDVMSNARINRKILRSLPIRFLPKITSIEDNKDFDSMKKEDLVGEIQNYEIKFCKPKKEPKNIGIVLSIVSEKSSRHDSRTNSKFDISKEDITYFVKKFKKLFRNPSGSVSNSRNSNGVSSSKNNGSNSSKGSGSSFNKDRRDRNRSLYLLTFSQDLLS